MVFWWQDKFAVASRCDPALLFFADLFRLSCLRYLSLKKGTDERPALNIVSAGVA